MLSLNPKSVDDLYVQCIHTGEPDPSTITVDGVMSMVTFKRSPIDANKKSIAQLLYQLPPEFFQDTGGGVSMLKGTRLRSGALWGSNDDAEKLFQLGVAAGFVKELFPRNIRHSLPGSVPYYVIGS